MLKRTEEDLKKIGEDFGLIIYGLATVSDDYINQLKTYHNLDISDITGRIWFETMGLFIQLFVARIDDITTMKERVLLERAAIDAIVRMFEILDLRDRPDAKKGAKELKNVLTTIIDSHRKYEVKHDKSIVESYTISFTNSFKGVPNQLSLSYLQSKIELFEEENIRQKFEPELGL